jgi:hypothetical protein
MPGGDRTGPTGMGPLTGRGAGFCRGNAQDGFGGNNRGQGFVGRGGGRGRRNCFRTTGLTGWQRLWPGLGRFAMGFGAAQDARGGVESPDDLQALKHQAGFLEGSLKEIRSRIEELDAPAKK